MPAPLPPIPTQRIPRRPPLLRRPRCGTSINCPRLGFAPLLEILAHQAAARKAHLIGAPVEDYPVQPDDRLSIVVLHCREVEQCQGEMGTPYCAAPQMLLLLFPQAVQEGLSQQESVEGAAAVPGQLLVRVTG